MQKYPENLLEPIREFLLSQEKYLRSRKKSISREDPYLTLGNPTLDDEPEAQFDHDKAQAIKDQLGVKIEQTKLALKRIKSGEYGFCASCKNMINTDRLAIYPEAIYCIQCEQIQENLK